MHGLKAEIASIKHSIGPCASREREEKDGQVVPPRDEVVHPCKARKSVQALGVYGGIEHGGGVEAEQNGGTERRLGVVEEG